MKRLVIFLALVLSVGMWSSAGAVAAPVRSIALSPATVAGGGTVNATVNLTAYAETDQRVSLSSSSSYADVPSSVVVPQGRKSVAFKITTSTTTVRRTSTISATSGDATKNATLTIDALALSSVSASPSMITSASSVTGTVKLNGNAPSGGYAVALESSWSVVDVPATVTVPYGKSSATFVITSGTVSTPRTMTITAAANGITKTYDLKVAPLAITKLSGNSSITGSNPATGKVTFNGKTGPSGATVALTSSDPALASVPSTVTATANVNTVTFPITTTNASELTTVTITATYRDSQSSFDLVVKPVVLYSVAVDPRVVIESSTATVKVALTGKAPQGGVEVALESSDSAFPIRDSITIPAGAAFATVPVTAYTVHGPVPVTVTASLDDVTKTGSFNIVPITLSSVFVSNSQTGGNTASITLALNAEAPAGGLTVQLESSDVSLISLPESVDIEAGRKSYTFTYLSAVVSEESVVVLTASHGDVEKTMTVTIKPARFYSVGLNPGTTTGGSSVDASIILTGPAPVDGLIVDLSAAIVPPTTLTAVPFELPSSVLVPSGERLVRITLSTSAVPVKTIVAITGTADGVTVVAKLTINGPLLLDFNPRPIAVSRGGDTPVVVRLTGPAPSGGIVVSLSSSRPAIATVPTSVTVPAGSRTVMFDVSGAADAPYGQSTDIKVTALGKSITAPASMSDLLLSSFTLSTDTVMGGQSVTGTVTLTGPAPSGGVAVGINVTDPYLSVPATVTVAPNATSAAFQITTLVTPTNRSVVVYTTFASSGRSADLALEALSPISLTIDDTDIEGGQSLVGTVTLNGLTPATASQSPVTVTLTASPSKVTFPATVTFGRSETTVSFTIIGVPVSADTAVTLVATVNGGSVSNSGLTVHHPGVVGLSIADNQVTGGGSTTGTVTLSSPAPTGGWQVNASSGDAAATTATSTTVSFGQTTASFFIATTPVAVDTVPTITAARNGTSATATFTVKPPRLTALSLNDDDLEGGFASATGTVTLNGAAPTGGWTIALSRTGTAISVPATVTVPAGSTSTTFSVASNLVPADATSTVTATKVADAFSATLTVRQIKVTTLSVLPGSIQGGGLVTGSVTLNRSVPTTGVAVVLSSNSGAAFVAGTVTVPINQMTTTFTVSTVGVASDTVAQITASFNGGSASQNVTVLAPVVAGVAVSPSTMIGGPSTATGTVTISHAAPLGGFVVALTASNGGASVPASVTVAAGATTATFTVSTAVVAADRSVTITADRSGVSKTTTIVVSPLLIGGVSLSPSTVSGGDQNSTGTVTLNAAAPAGGAVVSLTSSHGTYAFVPATVTIPAGSTNTTFTVTTSKRSTGQAATVTATYNGASQTAVLQVDAPLLSSLAVAPTAVVGGGSVTGTVTLGTTAGTDGFSVALASSNTSVVAPGSVTVASGQMTATFTVTTLPVSANGIATITATANGISKTASFTINAPTLSGLSVSPSSVVGGTSATTTATISSAAPSGGLTISTSSDKTQAAPATITIAAGATSGSATVTTQAVAADTTVTLTGTLNSTSRTASFTINAPTLTAISVSPSSVLGGGSVTATATISSTAPSGGLTIAMASNKTQAIPANITIAAGATSGTGTVTTLGVAADLAVTLTGTLNGTPRTATFTITRTTLSSVSMSAGSVLGGGSLTVTATLTGIAPVGGITVAMSSNVGQATPGNVVVAAGATSGTATVTTQGVLANTVVTVTGSYNGTATTTFTINRTTVSSVSVSPTSVRGGNTFTFTVTLNGVAPTGGMVITAGDNSDLVAMPGSITVAAGASSATITVGSSAVGSDQTKQVGVYYDGITYYCDITLLR